MKQLSKINAVKQYEHVVLSDAQEPFKYIIWYKNYKYYTNEM